MIRALWTSATGMRVQQMNVDVIANNLANVNTTGFKRSRTDFQDLLYQSMRTAGSASAVGTEYPAGIEVGLGARVVSTPKVFTQGNYRETGNLLDMLVEGEGFFQVTMPDGELAYTRNGSFKVDSEGRLTTADGWLVSPEVTIPEEATEVIVGSDGTVSILNGETGLTEDLGVTIELANFINPAGLAAAGHSMFTETEASGEPVTGIPGEDTFGTITQGFLELSNVSVVEEMVNLIAGQRAYEISSRAIQAADDMLQTANTIKR